MTVQNHVLTQPTDEQIMGVLNLTVTSTEQLCDRLRSLFDSYGLPTLEEMEHEVHDVNTTNGWFDAERSPLEGDMLMVTEVAEASEAYRAWGMDDMTGIVSLEKALTDPATGVVVHKPEGVASEYADQFIRLLDQVTRAGFNLRAEYDRKIVYNRLRGYMHGGKRI